MSADQAYLLTPNDVRNIRSYVHHKYSAMPNEQRAEIVADAVTRIIHKQLPEFSPPVKRELTRTLIRTTVLEHQRPVSADDVYALCLELDQRDEAIAGPLRRWVREKEAVLFLTESSSTAGQLAEASSRLAEVIPLRPPIHPIIRRRRRDRLLLYGVLSACVVAATVIFNWTISTPQEGPVPVAQQQTVQPAASAEARVNELPDELRYADIDRKRLIGYLDDKSSLLAEPRYFDAIIDASKQFDIHPAFLFAITGQEQAFVPASHERAKEIANNPFNVFHSWQDFNTTIEQSAQIAARTIVRLSKDRPAEVNPFTWINREYAEDPNWSKGVESIFRAIVSVLNEPV
ncbi:hypothetical protein [Paenibacillus soyae]|uniref:Mannosyl-glycoprotein endo-beta-N-acetylglucosaminidase n=1 Tax=Paenibacillus soyae TaxID=2969249 RepID=A0A9X2MRX3_9BACL|nr:hypothetical protein [Paenibacillus soyae]MCR2802857.1 hypothetical protein [Paenibacillus soyae]